jgi:hypothetical protein
MVSGSQQLAEEPFITMKFLGNASNEIKLSRLVFWVVTSGRLLGFGGTYCLMNIDIFTPVRTSNLTQERGQGLRQQWTGVRGVKV